MNSLEYRKAMDRRFAYVFFFCVALLLLGFVMEEMGARGLVILVLPAFALFLLVSAVVWWNISVLPKMRELERKECPH